MLSAAVLMTSAFDEQPCSTCPFRRDPFVVRVRAGKCPPNARRYAMTKYLLSTHTVEDQTREPRTEEEMHELGRRVGTIEREMKASGAWGFSGRLHEPDTATVVRVSDGDVLTTDGPFAESKEHLAGFYIIEAEDLDAALGWASKVTAAINAPIEVRPFAAFADEPMG
jgi:hypothetical protein